MEELDEQWEKLQSRSRPGKFYFYNRTTKQSVWKLPTRVPLDTSTESKAEDKMVSSGAPAPLGGAGISVSSAIPGVGSGTGPATGQFDSRNGLLGNSVGGATGSPVESGLKADVGSSGGSGHQVESYEVEENQLGTPERTLYRSNSVPGPDSSESQPKETGRPVSDCSAEQSSSLGSLAKIEDNAWDTVIESKQEELESPITSDDEVGLDAGLTPDLQLDIQEAINKISLKLDPCCSAEGVCEGPLPVTDKRFKHELYLVLDTGALLTHLQALQEFRAGPIRSLGKQAVLVVPWVVLVKMSQLLKSTVPAVKKRVGKAAEFLRECISSEHPNIIFQTLDEAICLESTTTGDANPVVRCSHDYQHAAMARQSVAVLWTDDIMLASAALTSGVRAVNRKTLLPMLFILTGVQQRNVSIFGGSGHYNHFTQSLCVCDCELVVCSALSVVITKEMIAAYDTLWSAVVAVKPPWTLQNTLAIVDKHWMAVFGFLVDRTLKRTCLDKLVLYGKTHSNCIARPVELEQFVRQAITLLTAFANQAINKYDDLLGHAINILTTILQNYTSRPTVGGAGITGLNQFHQGTGNPFKPSSYRSKKPVSPAGVFGTSYKSFQKPGSPKNISYGRKSNPMPDASHVLHQIPSPIPISSSGSSPYTSSSPVLVGSPTTPLSTPISSSQPSPALNSSSRPTPTPITPVTPPLTPTKTSYSGLSNKDNILASSSDLPVHGVIKSILNSRPSRGRGRGRVRAGSLTTDGNPQVLGRANLHSESPLVEDVSALFQATEAWQDSDGILKGKGKNMSTAHSFKTLDTSLNSPQ